MMKIALALALLVGAQAKLFTMDENKQKFMWQQFKREHNKTFPNEEQEKVRFEIFVANLAVIDERNAREKHAGGSAQHGITKFSDLTQEEFEARYLTAKPTGAPSKATPAQIPPLKWGSDVVADWSGTYTTPVKDQGYCGSCWAFSATEQIESDTMRNLGETFILSPAQIAQCDSTAYGCDGGWTEHAYSYVERAGGIETADDYPYPTTMYYGTTGSCSSDSSDFKVTVDDYYSVSGESSMASYMGDTGPLSVCLDASTWNSYTGGIMKVCGNSVDHCVQAVGVDTGNGYWKVRNSWGTSWGESGYIRLSYGSNTCDITNDPTYVKTSLV